MCRVSQFSAAEIVVRYVFAASGQIPKAAQTTVVVLRLLRLQIVSPQPPSAFAWLASQDRPFSISKSYRASAGLHSRFANASATTAVAVESALADSLPLHKVFPQRSSSSVARAF